MSFHVASICTDHKFGSAPRKQVITFLADKASDDGSGIWCSKGTVAQSTELSKSTVTRDELQTLVSGLRQSSSVALDGLRRDILSQLSVILSEVTTRRMLMNEELSEIRKSPRRLILSSAAIAATITAIFWSGPSLWMMWQLGNVTVQSAENGTFLVLPSTAQTGWTCGGNPCVKLKE